MQNMPLNSIDIALNFELTTLCLPRVVNPQHTLTICPCVKNKDMKRKQQSKDE